MATQVVTGYEVSTPFGPIDVGANSPLGGLFSFASGISGDYSTGLAAAENDPQDVGAYFAGNPLTVQQIQNIKDASQQSLGTGGSLGTGENPVAQGGAAAGTILGTGFAVIGNFLGLTGKSATPGVVSGVGGAAAGISQVGVAGVVSGVTGAVSGGVAGIGSALTGGAGVGGDFLLIGGALLIALAFLFLI